MQDTRQHIRTLTVEEEVFFFPYHTAFAYKEQSYKVIFTPLDLHFLQTARVVEKYPDVLLFKVETLQ